MYKEQLIREALGLPLNAIEYYVSQILADHFPKKVLVEGGDMLFNLEEYIQTGLCTIDYQAIVYNQVLTHWRNPGISSLNRMMPPGIVRFPNATTGMFAGSTSSDEEIVDRAKNAWLAVKWQEQDFDIVVMNWTEGNSHIYHYWIISESNESAKALIKVVCRWNAEIRGEVLVFDNGHWCKNSDLFQAIKNATLDNLILRGSLKEEISADLNSFFSARETYETYGVPWKRGIIFVGPPGNGKTHAVKALINSLHQPCLYVKSFKTQFNTDEENIHRVFERARQAAPCILVLEDLDSLVTAQNRSFFLNELDGFADNIGIVTLATTNHPERLDPSILDRPSRFDRKYPFDLPEIPERIAYISMWNEKLQSSLRISDAVVQQLSERTESFSFAYLKELFLSSMMRWISTQQGSMEEIMLGQIDTLREQMISAQALAAQVVTEEPAELSTPWIVRAGRIRR